MRRTRRLVATFACILASVVTTAHASISCSGFNEPIAFTPAQPDSSSVTFVRLNLGKLSPTAIEASLDGNVVTVTSYGLPIGISGPASICETIALGPLAPGAYEIRHLRGGLGPGGGATPALLGTYAFTVAGPAPAPSRTAVLVAGIEKQASNLGGGGATYFTLDLANIGTTDVTLGLTYPRGPVTPRLTCMSGATVIRPGERCVAEVPVSRANLLPADDTIGIGTATVGLVVNGGELSVPFNVYYSAYLDGIGGASTPMDFGSHVVGSGPATLTREFRNSSPLAVDVDFTMVIDAAPNCPPDLVAPMACQAMIEAAAASFALNTPGCVNVPPQGTCTASVTFEPKASAGLGATLHAGAAFINGVTVDLRGTGIAPRADPNTVLAIEYRHDAMDHYFVTVLPGEIEALDTGRLTGWARTGRTFWVYPTESVLPSDVSPVCRFYGRPEAGLDSHFYSASPAECQEVAARFGASWILESTSVFAVKLTDAAGRCPGGTSPLYRVFNARKDANHRYTVDAAVRDSMVLLGGIAEGNGSDIVAMCVPQ